MRVHVLAPCQGGNALIDEVRTLLRCLCTGDLIPKRDEPFLCVRKMALELHVWGPAFGLPSIDPECIGTVMYCQRVIPEGQWRLVASYDKSVGLTGMF